MVRRVAMVFGVVFLLVGILGLVAPGGMKMGADPAPATLLGMFPVNLPHNVVHILFGIWGLVAARSFAGARQYAQFGGAFYLLLAICGFFIPTVFGLIPIGGNAIWLHGAIGIVLAAVGYTAREGLAAAPAAT